MVQKGFRLFIDGAYTDVDLTECLKLSRDRKIPYAPAYLNALFSRRTNTIPSPSVLASGCLRGFYIGQSTEEYPYLTRLHSAACGTAWHLLLQNHNDSVDGVSEMGLTCTFDFPDLPQPYNHIVLSGTSDLVQVSVSDNRFVVVDYKTKGTGKLDAKFTLDEKHIYQISVYALLYYKTYGVAPKEFELFYIARDAEHDYVNNMPKTEVGARFWGELDPVEETEAKVKNQLYTYCKNVSVNKPPPVDPDFHKKFNLRSLPQSQGRCFLCPGTVKIKCQEFYKIGS